MNALDNYNKMILEQETLALATSIDNKPNVRIVNFITSVKKGVLYFSTFKGNNKEKEFNINNNVAFTTIPNHNTGHIKVNRCRVIKSDLSILDLEEEFVSKLPEYKEIIDKASDFLVVYELHFSKLTVTMDFENITELELDLS